MKQLIFGQTDLKVPAVILGCMRLLAADNPVDVLETAVEEGITFFDHADIYKDLDKASFVYFNRFKQVIEQDL